MTPLSKMVPLHSCCRWNYRRVTTWNEYIWRTIFFRETQWKPESPKLWIWGYFRDTCFTRQSQRYRQLEELPEFESHCQAMFHNFWICQQSFHTGPRTLGTTRGFSWQGTQSHIILFVCVTHYIPIHTYLYIYIHIIFDIEVNPFFVNLSYIVLDVFWALLQLYNILQAFISILHVCTMTLGWCVIPPFLRGENSSRGQKISALVAPDQDHLCLCAGHLCLCAGRIVQKRPDVFLRQAMFDLRKCEKDNFAEVSMQ